MKLDQRRQRRHVNDRVLRQVERLHVDESRERLEVGNLIAGQVDQLDVDALFQTRKIRDLPVLGPQKVDVFQVVLFELLFVPLFQFLADGRFQAFVGKERGGRARRGPTRQEGGEECQNEGRLKPFHRAFLIEGRENACSNRRETVKCQSNRSAWGGSSQIASRAGYEAELPARRKSA